MVQDVLKISQHVHECLVSQQRFVCQNGQHASMLYIKNVLFLLVAANTITFELVPNRPFL
jgi:hypothetical protein